MGFLVRKTACATCIYKMPWWNVKKLEADVTNASGFLDGHRICHEGGTVENQLCCRGFWNRHKDYFPMGQLCQRLELVVETDQPEEHQ